MGWGRRAAVDPNDKRSTWSAETHHRFKHSYPTGAAHAAACARIFEGEDARWALVSTSVTALVAGSVAWLAAGTIPQTAPAYNNAQNDRSLLPYQVFMRLTAQDQDTKASYASIGPAASLATETGHRPAARLARQCADGRTDGQRRQCDDSGIDTRTHHAGIRRYAGRGTDRCRRQRRRCQCRRRRAQDPSTARVPCAPGRTSN